MTIPNTISRTKDFRKRKKREMFFGMPFQPLFVFLLLILTLLIVPQSNLTQQELGQNEQRQVGFPVTTTTITGEVVSGLSLKKINWEPNKAFDGNFSLILYTGDFVPVDSNISFKIHAIKCKNYYTCDFGEFVKWEYYDINTKKCKNYSYNASGWENSPWEDVCADNYATYECDDYNKKCCVSGNGLGGYYANLVCSGGKECWDECSGTSQNQLMFLVNAITKSTTPHSGNYSTDQTYKNVNNTGQTFIPNHGAGFGYCFNTQGGGTIPLNIPNGASYTFGTQHPPSATGYAVQQPPGPDLTVESIYIKESGGVQPPTGMVAGAGTKKVYARIKNIGTMDANNFVVRAEWNTVPYMPGMGNFKEVTVNYLGAGQEYEFEINNLDSIRNMELKVFADYYNSIAESNEANNEKKAYLGCLDFDDGINKEIKARCIDFSGEQEDNCDMNTENYLFEYTCEPEVGGYIGESCYANHVLCEQGCEDGKCVQAQPQNCKDSDNGKYPLIFGTCSDMLPLERQDECIPKEPGKVKEVYCKMPDDACAEEIMLCPSGTTCINGRCTSEIRANLIITNIERVFGQSSDVARITINNTGEGDVTATYNLTILVYDGTSTTTEKYTLGPLAAGRGYTKDSQKNIAGKTVYVTAIADSDNDINEANENDNNLTVLLQPYSCKNWNSVYYVKLSDLNLKTPSLEGAYYFNVSFYHKNTYMSSHSVTFIVTKPQTHKACQNHQCVSVSGSGSDSCSSSSDCVGAGVCNENWLYRDWSACVSGKRTRECYDANACDTTEAKPTFCLELMDKFIESQECCESSWSCDEWSACYEYQGGLIQSMTCNDANRCNSQNVSYAQLRDCCSENWQCEWSPCIGSKETLICQETNGCDTEFMKPQEESRACQIKTITKLAWWIWLIIIVIIIAITLTVLFITKVIKWPFGKKKGEAKESITSARASAYPELANYIKSAMAAGMSKDEIKRKLTEAGWPEDAINSELNK